MNTYLANPFTLWLRWLIKKIYWEVKYRKAHLYIEYLVDIKDCKFGNHNSIYKYTRLLECTLGDYTYISKNCQFNRTKIGKFCSIGPNVIAGLGIHPSSNYVSTHPLFFSSRGQARITFLKKNIFEEYIPIEIGNDVWIGANVIIKDGIKIGNGAIIGAGAVVTKNVPAYAIAGGVPAKIIKYRFTEEEILFLQHFQWWNKDLKWIKENNELFRDIKKFKQVIQNKRNISS